MIASLRTTPIFASAVQAGPLQPLVMCQTCHSVEEAHNGRGKTMQFPGDKPVNNGDNARSQSWQKSI
jgi:hypothetical protein